MLSFEAWPGTSGPVTRTIDRRPGSVRRMTSIRSTRPEALDGPLVLAGWGRDVLSAADGTGVVLDEVSLEVTTEGPARTVVAIESDPPVPGLSRLAGISAMAGFRKAASTASAGSDGTVLGLVLDDLPGAALVSGSARIRANFEATGRLPDWKGPDGRGLPVVCIGRRVGGAMDRRRRAGDPLLGQGPPAGDLRRPDDPVGHLDEPALPAHGMRRLRRIDVVVEGDELVIDTHFRDSHMESSGVETSVHEYEVVATVGVDDHEVRTVEVRPRVLPGPDCPGAAASAQRIVGERLEGLRDLVRVEMGGGDTTCTHLNDQLRSLADAPTLLRALATA